MFIVTETQGILTDCIEYVFYNSLYNNTKFPPVQKSPTKVISNAMGVA